MILSLLTLLQFGEFQQHSDILIFTELGIRSNRDRLLAFQNITKDYQTSIAVYNQKVELQIHGKSTILIFEMFRFENFGIQELNSFLDLVTVTNDNIKINASGGDSANKNGPERAPTSACACASICMIWSTSDTNKKWGNGTATASSMSKLIKFLNELNTRNNTILVKRFLGLNSCFYFVTQDEIYEIYNLFGEIISRKISMDGGSAGLAGLQSSILWRRKNYQQGLISAGHVKPWELFSRTGAMLLSKSQTGTYEIFSYMQDFLNFSTIIRSYKDWHILAQNVDSGIVDFGLSATAMLKSTAKDFRFSSTPTYTEKVMAYYANPEEVSSIDMSNFLHVKPFRLEAWILAFATLGILVVCHALMSNRIADSLWWAISCFTLQGTQTTAVQNSLRVLMFTGSIFVIILYATYSGSLISSLSTKKEKVWSLQELFEKRFTFGITNDSFLRAAKEAGDYIKNSLADKIFTGLHPTKGEVHGIKTGVNFVLENKHYVFMTEENVYEQLGRIYIDKDNGKTLCKVLRDIPIPEYTVQQSPISRPDSPYMDHFNLARLRMREFGLWDLHIKRRQKVNNLMRPVCPKRNAFKSFDNTDVVFPEFIIILGYTICSISLLLEIILNVKSKLFISGANIYV